MTDPAEAERLAQQNRADAEEFCKGAFGSFVTDVSQYTEIVHQLLQRATDRAASDRAAISLDREALDLLQLQQRGRAKAFRMLDKAREKSDPETLAKADAYEECGNELRAALALLPATPRLDREAVAELVWNRFAPDHETVFAECRFIAEYRDCADAILALVPTEPPKVIDPSTDEPLPGFQWGPDQLREVD